ncbi:MAG: FHA domain-containing protein [Microcoleus sp. PH2017_10_PVI_O_A]|uniref:FHA domain-containing protein n=1 Tax=unclassified Microcoleus TaxID=2642155 RepID=UPI001D6216B3|nr:MULTISPECIES: FHA domain-containing protein [unclassified Microcoleus]TAE84767.1 MAG: FHA domain-containing protein [Oscillatoriales cyanobacterium]MCC3406389.1 FHA domain-containing protein [Microcoleus sp. PH2017_10_PVI_O_A]MCC3459016.1 FHA domain-containing protein [Microcoleus sp. PH2017_11_PCY_U_A]MCC3477847.1 FHA domain-containing protein [Microcoleus sp. PH2017_12_PCY_D_A]MCC3527790.1 FHA domain-containing protein [Microcoleus sp. PH2017_21_RUC_O_A]
MITLTLLHPIQSVPVQSWCFESESVVRIGRSNDNDVIIYSAVVSRHHVELWNHSYGWEIINFGANGTYVDDKPIAQVSVADGMTIRLGNSGPKIRIRVGATNVQPSKITRPPQREKAGKKDEVSKENSTTWSGPRAIIEDDEEGALTHIDFD